MRELKLIKGLKKDLPYSYKVIVNKGKVNIVRNIIDFRVNNGSK